MKLSELSIKRPVLAIVFSLVLVLFGLFSYQSLSVREYPNIDPPNVSVTTTYVAHLPKLSKVKLPRSLKMRSPELVA